MLFCFLHSRTRLSIYGKMRPSAFGGALFIFRSNIPPDNTIALFVFLFNVHKMRK